MTFKQRLGIVILFSVYFALTYKGIQVITLKFLTPVTMPLPGEASLPFVPWMIWIYMLVYVVPALVILFPPHKGQVFKMIRVFFLASLIHYAFFLLLPVHYDLRPNASVMAAYPVANFIYLIDEPVNCFPSIHVSFVFLSYFFVKRYKPALSHAFLALAVLISISTVLVKQHFIVDVLAAIILSIGLNQAIIKRKFARQPPTDWA